MKTSLRSTVGSVTAFLVLTGAAQAHPGHDGHELTWDLSHLSAYPLATTGCFAVVAALGWVGWLFARRAATQRVQSLRVSQPSRGK
jgi:hypothetical protein